MKAIKNVATGATFIVREDENVMIAELKGAGIKFGKTSLKELLEGKRPQVNGFEVVDVEETPATNTAGAENVASADSGTQAAGDNSGASSGDQAGAQGDSASGDTTAPVGDAPVAAAPTLTPEPAAKPAPQPRQRKVIKAAEPKGKIKPVRKGTKIANGLDMLAAGCTEKALEDAEMSDDIVDFVNRRVTKRGYGIEVTGEGATQVIKLKFPVGVTSVQYTAAGAADDGDDAAPAANTPAADPAAPANTPADDAEPVDQAPPADAPAPAGDAAQA